MQCFLIYTSVKSRGNAAHFSVRNVHAAHFSEFRSHVDFAIFLFKIGECWPFVCESFYSILIVHIFCKKKTRGNAAHSLAITFCSGLILHFSLHNRNKAF